MKGVILAGGLGTRLDPMTRVTNKHLLPVYDRPMIYYPIQQLVHAGLTRILIVTGGDHAGDFLRLMGNGRDFGLRHLDYTYQEGEGGIAEALGLAEHFADGDKVCVILGDNVFQKPLAPHVEAFRRQEEGARILLKEVDDPERFGVAELDGDKVVGIEEKPARPKTPYAVTGCYFFDNRVFDIIRTLEPSERGELEITDVNNDYITRGEMSFGMVEGWWTDAGTVASLHRAGRLVAEADGEAVLRSMPAARDRDGAEPAPEAGRAGGPGPGAEDG
jgi:glucose-1-phosphate thymidylyltransferase